MRFPQIAQEVLLSGTVRFLASAGVPRTSIVQRLRTLADTVEAGRNIPTPHSDNYDFIVTISSVVHDWTRTPEFTGRDGEPKALSLRGRSSLSMLIRKRFPTEPVSPIVSWMTRRGIVRRRTNGRYMLLQRAVLVGNPDPAYLEWAATAATQYLKTAFENWKQTNPNARQLDRIARVFDLPEREVANFRVFAKGRAESWLEEIDNWLEDHGAPQGRRRKIEAGVHVYGYVRPAGSAGNRESAP